MTYIVQHVGYIHCIRDTSLGACATLCTFCVWVGSVGKLGRRVTLKIYLITFLFYSVGKRVKR